MEKANVSSQTFICSRHYVQLFLQPSKRVARPQAGQWHESPGTEAGGQMSSPHNGLRPKPPLIVSPTPPAYSARSAPFLPPNKILDHLLQAERVIFIYGIDFKRSHFRTEWPSADVP